MERDKISGRMLKCVCLGSVDSFNNKLSFSKTNDMTGEKGPPWILFLM